MNSCSIPFTQNILPAKALLLSQTLRKIHQKVGSPSVIEFSCSFNLKRPQRLSPMLWKSRRERGGILQSLLGDASETAQKLAEDIEKAAENVGEAAQEALEESKEVLSNEAKAFVNAKDNALKFVDDVESRAEKGSEEFVENVKMRAAPEYASWNSVTENLTLLSTATGLFMMAPQIAKNATLLASGQAAAVGILSWVAFSTGFLGNMLLLSYFAGKKEASAALVQVVGAASTAALLSQIYLAGYMPLPAFLVVSSFLVIGVLVNGLNYFGKLPEAVWAVFEDINALCGLTVLPQVLWQTVFPGLPSLIPAAVSAGGALTLIVARRMGKLPKDFEATWRQMSGWTATLLFMLMPVAQLKECFLHPASLAGMSVLAPIMAIISNGLMVPRALFTRDTVWLTGCTWGTFMMGWAILLSMALQQVVPTPFFLGVTMFLVSYLMAVYVKDSKAHQLPTPFDSILNTISGKSV